MINLSNPALNALTAGHIHILFLCHHHGLLSGDELANLPRTYKPATRSLNRIHRLIRRRHKGYELTTAGKIILDLITAPETAPTESQREFVAALPPGTTVGGLHLLHYSARYNTAFGAEKLAHHSGHMQPRAASGVISHLVKRNILEATNPAHHNPRTYRPTTQYQPIFKSIKTRN